MKEKLLAALPFFNTIDGSVTYNDISGRDRLGKFDLAGAGISANFNGA